MEAIQLGKIEKPSDCHAPEVSKQTGFPSAATHYMEATIDLNKELSRHRDATFFVRIQGQTWAKLGVKDQDVLIIDRSLKPHRRSLILAVDEGSFVLHRMGDVLGKEALVLWGVVTYIIHRTV
ncbi:MAG TPA: S24 family peptidase [Flavobacteriaceae bacterium]|nr:peptidase S24 [Flavobacteriaceae bacterium]MCB9213502.1 peptidase S24 [Alteromonas sp.]HPF10728.1 S24 family peptidase [Flavobacteriaceae bacterium]HQU21564.1 S24 family peptidase [Flavobacteriaceae bacterium]HQU65533.1 S24 family peptidase [Flavobacteriaceae bacterium]